MSALDPDDVRAALAEARSQITQLTQSERRLVEAQRISGVGSYDFELATGVNIWSDQLYRIYGREPQSFNADYETFLSMVHPDDREHVVEVHQTALATLSPYEMEERILWPDGQVRTLATWGEVVVDDEGKPARMVGICWDVTEQKALEQELANAALHDRLTGLANRSLLEDRLKLAVSMIARHARTLGVLFIDIDRFKVINDSLGHQAGDQVLVVVANRLRCAVRPGDTVARFGGDEFVVLCEELSSPGEALHLAHRVQEAVSQPLLADGAELVLSVSTGIALTSDATAQHGALLRDADSAMYHAKRGGRARSVVFVDEMRDEARGRLETETQLRRGIAEGQLRVLYQPVVNVASGALVGVEALVRWQHPERGLLPPAEFVPIAEETGLVVPLGEWVLEETCRQLVEWQTRHPTLTASVNLSGVQITEPEVITRVAAVIARTGVPATSLALEITETILMRDAEETLSVLRALTDLGVQLHVDDFGTGYSSLNYLKRFPVDALKIDRSFVDGLATDPEDQAIVRAILALARSLGLTTVAEGVETQEQLAALRLLGCDTAQGYLFSTPVEATAVTRMLGHSVPGARVPTGEKSMTRAE